MPPQPQHSLTRALTSKIASRVFPNVWLGDLLAVALAALGLLSTAPAFANALAPVAVESASFAGSWRGSVEVPGSPLEVEITLRGEAPEMTGEISIPVQGVQGIALDGFALNGENLRFSIRGLPGNPTFSGALSEGGETFSGTFAQAAALLTFSLERQEDPAALARDLLAGLEPEIERAVEAFGVPGMALAVVRGDEVIYARGFGLRDREKELPMTADTLFPIGSSTKAMTATVLAMQVEEGKLSWDEPVTRFLPTFRLEDPAITARVTPRDLMSHRTGMPRHELLWYSGLEIDRGELVSRLEHLELTGGLREGFQYNNLMVMTAGYLSGRLDDGTWEES
ncbi:MAG: serine hydrolase domain-containing protein, partial [Acidobacteriota bacterium]